MLLTTNINNTNTMIGLYNDTQWIASWRIKTDRSKQQDEYAKLLRNLFRHNQLSWSEVTGVALASVVPPLTATFVDMYQRYFHIEPLVVTNKIETGVKILIDYPAEAGADRILNALAAKELHGCPCIVVDFDTATTFDSVSRDGNYLGGAIAPGLGIAAEAFFSQTAKLPRIELVFSVVSLSDQSDDKHFWFAMDPIERMRHIEVLRRINYGHGVTSRLQRILEYTED